MVIYLRTIKVLWNSFPSTFLSNTYKLILRVLYLSIQATLRLFSLTFFFQYGSMVIRHMLWVKVTAFWIVRDSVDFIRSWTFKNRAKEDRDSKKAILPWWWPYHKEISPRTKCEGGSPSVVKWTRPISPTYKYKRNSEFPEQTIPEIERIRKQDNPIFD